MAVFRKRQIEVEAFRWNPDKAPNWVQIPPSALWFMEALISKSARSNKDGSCTIQTREGAMRADPGDWIVRGVKGEFYPVKPDIFAETYEPAD